MKPPKYNLEQPSPKGRPGFERFKEDTSDQFYFHFNDEQGRPLLFSQGYHSASDRDNGLKSVKKNFRQPERIGRMEDAGSFFFVIRAGNHQEIARSRNFSSEKEMEAAINSLLPPVPENPPGAVSVEAESFSTAQEKSFGHQDPKYTFRLTIYQQGNRNSFSGKIEYLQGESRESFQGLDFKAIQDFVVNQLPNQQLVEEQELLFELLDEGVALDTDTLNHDKPLEVDIKLEANSLPADTAFEADITAKALGSGNQILIGRRRGSVAGRTKALKVPIFLNSLEPGPYRLQSSVRIRRAAEEETQEQTYEGSRLVMVY